MMESYTDSTMSGMWFGIAQKQRRKKEIQKSTYRKKEKSRRKNVGKETEATDTLKQRGQAVQSKDRATEQEE